MSRNPRYAERPDNSFDLVRVVAASLVLVYHCFGLSGTHEPFHEVLGITLGTAGLLVFFGVSGYLVAASWLRDERASSFAVKRALRILPALFVCSWLTAFVLGPLVSSLSPSAYFGSGAPYAYAAKQSVLVTFNPTLPGVFSHNPLPDVVNGSTWTLPVEACCYVAVALAGALAVLRRPRILLALLAVVVLAMVAHPAPDSATGHPPVGADKLLDALRPCGAFLTGVCLWVLRARVPNHRWLVALAVLLLFPPVGLGLHSAIGIIALPYLAITLGTLPAGRLRGLTARGDVTYGLYIYAYPIQQTLVHLAPGISAGVLALVALPIAWLVGLASWRTVEHPALALKARFARPTRPDVGLG